MTSDLRLSQLLSSRICHDLVGAAGAINAGIELINEDQSDIAAPLGLMETSAEQMTLRLSFFRVAFGSAGGADSPMPVADMKGLAERYLADKKIGLSWNTFNIADCEPAKQSLCGKIFLNLLLVSCDCLPRGGEVKVHVAPMNDGMAIAIEAIGVRARFPEDLQLALNTNELNDDLTVRNIHAFLVSKLAKDGGGRVEFALADGVVQFACVIVN